MSTSSLRRHLDTARSEAEGKMQALGKDLTVFIDDVTQRVTG